MKEIRVILLENIRSLHNVGAIFRSADGAGFQHIICSGYTPRPDDVRMKKVSLGAEESLSWSHVPSSVDAAHRLKREGFFLLAMETVPKATNLFFEPSFPEPIALIFGHEVDGISLELLSLADKTCFLPMHGAKESLNVSVATGIALYEVQRKRNFS
ncbi:TrmH family RNA methyltransferase [Candidatus Peregrinibacteria bacterium]|nr:MAG: TrmH family RNA methyltransferase [Candidatus Peregrinibacteria bacterium]